MFLLFQKKPVCSLYRVKFILYRSAFALCSLDRFTIPYVGQTFVVALDHKSFIYWVRFASSVPILCDATPIWFLINFIIVPLNSPSAVRRKASARSCASTETCVHALLCNYNTCFIAKSISSEFPVGWRYFLRTDLNLCHALKKVKQS